MLLMASRDPEALRAAAGVPIDVSAAGRGVVVLAEDEPAVATALSARFACAVVLVVGEHELAVYRDGLRIRHIVTDEDGTRLAGERLPFEDDLLDFDDDAGDDAQHLHLDVDIIEDYCARLGIDVRLA